MWESRPLPKIVRDPLAALSARGSFFVPAPPGIFLFWGWQADAWRFEERKACGEGNLFGKRFSLPAPLPSKNFCRWVCLLPAGLCMDGNGGALAVKISNRKYCKAAALPSTSSGIVFANFRDWHGKHTMVFYGPSCLFKASFLLPAADVAEFFPEQEHPSTCASHKKRLPVMQAVLMSGFGEGGGRGRKTLFSARERGPLPLHYAS